MELKQSTLMKFIYSIFTLILITGCEVGTEFYQDFTSENQSTNIFYCDEVGYMIEESVTIRSSASTKRIVTDSNGTYVKCNTECE